MTMYGPREILLQHLAKFRSWSYAKLADRVEYDRLRHDCLEHLEGVAPDGRTYQIEFQAFWDDKPNGDVRVMGTISVDPQRPLWGFIPIYTADFVECFIMSPDGRFVGEDENSSG
jgi:hypothetical protein